MISTARNALFPKNLPCNVMETHQETLHPTSLLTILSYGENDTLRFTGRRPYDRHRVGDVLLIQTDDRGRDFVVDRGRRYDLQRLLKFMREGDVEGFEAFHGSSAAWSDLFTRRMVERDLSIAEMAAEFGITRQRGNQLVADYERRHGCTLRRTWRIDRSDRKDE